MSPKEIKIVKPKEKVTNATEKLKIVQQKYSSMKITPSKFQTILEGFRPVLYTEFHCLHIEYISLFIWCKDVCISHV